MSARPFRLEIAYFFDRVGVRVHARCDGWQSAQASIKITGDLDPDEAIAFADALRVKAEEIKAKNAKREAADQRRKARMANLPSVSWR
jgi:hypothetical protein